MLCMPFVAVYASDVVVHHECVGGWSLVRAASVPYCVGVWAQPKGSGLTRMALPTPFSRDAAWMVTTLAWLTRWRRHRNTGWRAKPRVAKQARAAQARLLPRRWRIRRRPTCDRRAFAFSAPPSHSLRWVRLSSGATRAAVGARRAPLRTGRCSPSSAASASLPIGWWIQRTGNSFWCGLWRFSRSRMDYKWARK